MGIIEKNIWNLKDLMEYTGWSESYLYKLTSQRLIPHSKPFGKMMFFKRDEIELLLLSNKIVMAEALDSEAATFVTLNKYDKNERHG